jgi:hypothetical protein
MRYFLGFLALLVGSYAAGTAVLSLVSGGGPALRAVCWDGLVMSVAFGFGWWGGRLPTARSSCHGGQPHAVDL